MGSSKAADAAKANKRAEKKMTRQQLKRQERDQTRDLSRVDTLQAASGFSSASVTSQAYRRDFVELQLEEVEWLKEVGASRFNQWQAKEQAIKATGIAQGLGDAAQLAFSVAALLKTPTATT